MAGKRPTVPIEQCGTPAEDGRPCVLQVGHADRWGHIPECTENHCHADRRQLVNDDRQRWADGRCHRSAGAGTPHKGYGACKNHGGNTPRSVQGALTAMAEDQAATLGLPTNVNAIEALRENMQSIHGHVVWMRLQLHALETDEVFDSPRGQARLRAYNEMVKRLVESASAMTRGDAELALARYVGRQADLLGAALEWFLGYVGLADDPEAMGALRIMLDHMQRGEVPALERENAS